MTRDKLYAWAMEMVRDSARQRDFAIGILSVLAGSFDESRCGRAGSSEESDECEGGREALQRLAESVPATRMQHGAVVTTPAGG